MLDPVTGDTLASVTADGLDMAAAYAFARNQGGAALRALSYAQRAELLGAIVKVLQANRDKYFDISLKNSGTVQNDSAVDVDGGIYTLSYYAKLGSKLTAGQLMADGTADALARDNAFVRPVVTELLPLSLATVSVPLHTSEVLTVLVPLARVLSA